MSKTVKVTYHGQEYTLVYDSSIKKYKAEVTSPVDSSYQYNDAHYFPVAVNVKDEAGNETNASDTVGNFKDKLKLFVKEQIKPLISGITPSSGANITTSNPTFKFSVLDNSNGQQTGFSGINPDSIVLTVDGNTVDSSKITKKAVTGGYECTYTPTEAIPDGNCTFTVKVSDYDGNESDTASVTFKVDTAPPTLNINYPVQGMYTNQREIKVELNTSDAASSPVTVRIAVDGVDQGEVIVGDDGKVSKTAFLAGADGEKIISVTATDSAGKVSSAERKVILDTTPPEIIDVEITPNPVNCGQTFTIYVTLNEED